MQTNPLACDLEAILDLTPGLWDELRGQRIFITGGTGFFGRWILESFTYANSQLGLGAKAVVLTRHPDAFRRKAPHLAADPAISFHVGNVRDFEFPAGPFRFLIHAATEAGTQSNAGDPSPMLNTIVEGTRHTLDFAAQASVKKFLLTSSGAVYGCQPPDLANIPEDYPGAPTQLDPHAAYSEGKRAAERLGIIYARKFGLEVKIIRGFTFAGPYLPLDAHFAAGNFIRDALRKGPVVVKGDGTPLRSYLYAADLAIWLWTILLRGKSACPYNVGSEHAVSIASLAKLIAGIAGPDIAVRIARPPIPGQPPARYVPNTGRAWRELGLKETVTLEDTLRRTIDFYRKLPLDRGNA
ncbi:MAG: NAD-dependent epimerase/dehydratase family protein [Kiritimatiellae bacterium]|nr:NAD-dependent epimerase/dehydratase family protein [Kiritimatiellia bacterium]